MDKRTLIAIREYTYQGKLLKVPVFKKTSGYSGVKIMACYGSLEAYVKGGISSSYLDNIVLKALKKYDDRIVDRPFYEKDKYIYILGKKRFITNSISLKDSPNFFYIKSTCKDPINIYKKEFLKYLRERINYWGKIMGFDLSGYIIRTGLYISYYGICFPIKRQFKLDYRLFAYDTYVSDSVIVHEIAHLYDHGHDNKFYNFINQFMKDYDKRDDLLKKGKFKGEEDDGK